MNEKQRFENGYRFIARSNRKNKQVETVIDYLRTYNQKNELVSVRYVTSHDFMGQVVTRNDVSETTIAMGEKQ